MIFYFRIICICLLLTAGCQIIPTQGPGPLTLDEDNFLIWMMSDIQPRTRKERAHFQSAVDDMVTLGMKINIAIMAGDLLQSHSDEDDYNWFLQTRGILNLNNWFEVAGNHDARNPELFRKYIGRPPYYGVISGNVLLLMLSDNSGSAETNISDAAFNWWRDMVVNNQDRIIITVTHAQLRQSGLFTSAVANRSIQDSDRFAEVLKHYKVDVWASGHSHLPNWFPGKIRMQKSLGGTLFINVSAIRDDIFMDIESRLLVFKEGSNLLQIYSRNHSNHRFDSGPSTVISLRHNFHSDGSEPILIIPASPN